MHGAPAVKCPVARSGLQLRIAVLVISLGAVTWLTFAIPAQVSGWRQWIGFAALTVATFAAARAWVAAPEGLLQWDGVTWKWHQGDRESEGQLAVLLDWQQMLLLRFSAGGGMIRWIWLEREYAPDQWLPLRRALRFQGDTAVPAAGDGA